MWINQLWRRCFGRSRALPFHASRPRTARRPSGTSLCLEALEDRTLLSNYTVSSVADLVAAIRASNAAGGQNQIAMLHGSINGYYYLTQPLPDIMANNQLTIVYAKPS